MHQMQIQCSELCAGFVTNACSGEGVTCAVNCVLSGKAIVSNYTQQVPSKACSFSVISAAYVIRKFNTEEAAGGQVDKFVYMESIPKSMCRTASYFHVCVQNTTGGTNMALQQNQQAAWRVGGF